MQWEPTQIMDFEVQEDDLKDVDVGKSVTDNPAGYLIEISKLQQVLRIHIVPRSSSKYVVGRSPTCDIVIDKPSVSNKHASFEFEDGTLWVTDEGSTNRTSIGNEMPRAILQNKFCERGRAYQVISTQFVTFGDVHFRWLKYSDYHSFIEEMGANTLHELEMNHLKAHKNSQWNNTSSKSSVETDIVAVVNNLEAADSGTAGLVDTSTIMNRDETKLKSEHGKVKIDSDGFPMFILQNDSAEIVFSDEDSSAIDNSEQVVSRVPPTQVYNPCYEEGNRVYNKSVALEETKLVQSPEQHNNKLTATQTFDPAHLPLSESIKDKQCHTSQGSGKCFSKTRWAHNSQSSGNKNTKVNALPQDSLPQFLETQPWDFDLPEYPETQAFEPTTLDSQEQSFSNMISIEKISCKANQESPLAKEVSIVNLKRLSKPEDHEDGAVGVERTQSGKVTVNVKKTNRSVKQRIGALKKKSTKISKKWMGRKNKASCKRVELSRTSINRQLKIIKETQIKREKKRYYSSTKATSRKKQKVAKAAKSGPKKPYIIQTGSVKPAVVSVLKKMGAIILQNVEEKVSHLCMDEFRITGKFLCALAYCDYIVSNKWLTRCAELGSFEVPEAKYRVTVNKEMIKAQSKFNFKFSHFLRVRHRRHSKLFNGLKLYATKNVDPVYRKVFTMHGGKLSSTPGKKFNPSLIIVGADKSDEEAQELILKNLKVRTTNWVIAAVLSQKFPAVKKFRVKRIKK